MGFGDLPMTGKIYRKHQESMVFYGFPHRTYRAAEGKIETRNHGFPHEL